MGDIFKYEQPQAYIVESTEYDDKNDIPVLTAGQSFILGYTDERFGIKDANEENPVIIFDDFTTSSHYVDFPFKIKSSAMKLLTLNNPKDDIHCTFNVLQNIGYVPVSHERHWISTFAKFNVLLPKSPSEQKQIGAFFRQLNNLITLHQRNSADFVSRFFSDFTNTWEQRKLGEIADKVTEKNGGLQYIETFTNSAEFGIISQRDFFDHDIAKIESLNGYYIVRNEDFVYNPRISTSAPVEPINRNKLGRIGVMSPLYTVFRPHDVDTTYLEHFFKSKYWHSFMNYNGDSGARSDRFSIKDSVFFEMPIPIPHIEEQRKIGAYLFHLDNLITLHQCEYIFGK